MESRISLKQKVSFIILTAASLAGAVLALLLIQEFYGAASGAVKSVCRSGPSGINACRTVAESSYAALRGLPLIGELPVALLGFVYYGLTGFLSLLLFFKPGERAALLRIIFGMALAGIAADASLLYVSVEIIKAVCPLCTFTYIATGALFIFSAVGILTTEKKERTIPVVEVVAAFRSNIIPLAAAAVLLFAGGIFCARSARASVDSRMTGESAEREAANLINRYRDSSPQSIIIKDEPVLGSPDAPVKAVIFMDFTCDHCAAAGKIFASLKDRYPQALAVIYKNYPLDEPLHEMNESLREKAPGSFEAAAASLCALRQNSYMTFYEAAYAKSLAGGRFNNESLSVLAAELGLDRAVFEKCLNDPGTSARVKKTADEGDSLGVAGTPHVFINGRYIPTEYLDEVLLARLIEYLTE
jgi:protein-disulfide isomerase/uncharacterized membrane protein